MPEGRGGSRSRIEEGILAGMSRSIRVWGFKRIDCFSARGIG
ncbi:hypothetical protein ASZ90_010388 [hydrocarbon metagenome]|uniref:Uncharacterized protein n=1 Tax=hydrocarbon metagenome TaxID=938273 RepID=A0A0W8FGN9_9ZZZZ